MLCMIVRLIAFTRAVAPNVHAGSQVVADWRSLGVPAVTLAALSARRLAGKTPSPSRIRSAVIPRERARTPASGTNLFPFNGERLGDDCGGWRLTNRALAAVGWAKPWQRCVNTIARDVINRAPITLDELKPDRLDADERFVQRPFAFSILSNVNSFIGGSSLRSTMRASGCEPSQFPIVE